MNAERILERKRLAVAYYPESTLRAREILEVLIEHPEFSDGQVANVLSITPQDVGRIRRKYKIPTFSDTLFLPSNVDTSEWDKWCKEDDERLDNGVCKINLHYEELGRYQAIHDCKLRHKKYFHPRRKE